VRILGPATPRHGGLDHEKIRCYGDCWYRDACPGSSWRWRACQRHGAWGSFGRARRWTSGSRRRRRDWLRRRSGHWSKFWFQATPQRAQHHRPWRERRHPSPSRGPSRFSLSTYRSGGGRRGDVIPPKPGRPIVARRRIRDGADVSKGSLITQIGRRLWRTVSTKGFFSPRPVVVEHDPAAWRPHDLDDPFFDVKVQRRDAKALTAAAQGKSRRER
jgi:hypothetical protein